MGRDAPIHLLTFDKTIPQTMAIRVLLFEDNAPLREALSALIADEDGCTLVGAFGDCLRANDQVYQLQPDVILMDIDLPGRDGIQAVTGIHREFPHVEVLMLTVFDDDDRIFGHSAPGRRAICSSKPPPTRFSKPSMRFMPEVPPCRRVLRGG